MRSPAAATGPSTARPRPCSPPVWRPGPAARSSGASPARICSPPPWPRPAWRPTGSSMSRPTDEKSVLACFEEGLRHGGLGAVVGEVARLSMTASRRLQLCAEGSGTMGIAVRRWRRQAEAADFGQPTAAATRWRVTALPSSPLPAAGVGRPRWFVELIRCKAGECADFELEACDETGRLALPADLADRSLAAPAWQRRAAG